MQDLAALGQPVEGGAQVLADRALDVGRARDQLVERTVLQQPFRGGLGADLGDTRHVVDRVAHERLVVQHQVWRHAEFGGDAGDVAALAAHRVDDRDVLVHQLRQVLVAARHHHLDALLRRGGRECADHVVGLDAGHHQHRPAEQPDDFMDRLDLQREVLGHRRATGLVLRIQRVAKGRALGVENAGPPSRRDLAAQGLHHRNQDTDRAGGLNGAVCQRRLPVAAGVERAV